MADMISVEQAMQMLGCDAATLQNYINAGQIRAQDQGGEVLVVLEDVQALSGDDDEIVLAGDSDDLSIDLGSVVDDSSASFAPDTGEISAASDDSITFGDELEVVNFDEENTGELVFDDTQATENLSFTDSNTAVVSSVDETEIEATAAMETAITDGGDFSDDFEAAESPGAPRSSRRSARSYRAAAEERPVHWIFVVFAVLHLIVMALFVVPYLVLLVQPAGGEGDEQYYHPDHARWQRIGVIDTFYANLASQVAGFSVDSNPERWEELQEGAQHVPLEDPFLPSNYSSYRDMYRAGHGRDEEALKKSLSIVGLKYDLESTAGMTVADADVLTAEPAETDEGIEDQLEQVAQVKKILASEIQKAVTASGQEVDVLDEAGSRSQLSTEEPRPEAVYEPRDLDVSLKFGGGGSN